MNLVSLYRFKKESTCIQKKKKVKKNLNYRYADKKKKRSKKNCNEKRFECEKKMKKKIIAPAEVLTHDLPCDKPTP